MFEWLDQELAEIRTNRFHIVEGGVKESAATDATVSLPAPYKEFVSRFGRAKLYNRGAEGHRVCVFAKPVPARSWKGEDILRIGRFGPQAACFKTSLLNGNEESPVFEIGYSGGLTRVAEGFEEWLTRRCASTRKKFGKRKWAAVLAGPPPFTHEEQAIVKARRLFKFEVAEITNRRTLVFRVHNGSSTVLPYLSVGASWNNGETEGGLWLSVAHIGPGETGLIEREAYTKLVDPHELKIFALPDPDPSERDRYWEFRPLRR